MPAGRRANPTNRNTDCGQSVPGHPRNSLGRGGLCAGILSPPGLDYAQPHVTCSRSALAPREIDPTINICQRSLRTGQ
jgi:hypothetical protein